MTVLYVLEENLLAENYENWLHVDSLPNVIAHNRNIILKGRKNVCFIPVGIYNSLREAQEAGRQYAIENQRRAPARKLV